MIPLERTAAVLLCAGLSTRFGEGNKLLEPLDGKPLLGHAAGLLAGLPFLQRIAVTGGDSAIGEWLGGFRQVANPRPEDGQDSSVRIGIAAGLSGDAEAVLICLGDMPFVTAAHLAALSAAAGESVAMSFDGESRSPPVLIPRRLGEDVLARAGKSVRAVLAGLPLIEVEADRRVLLDFDTRGDFDAPH